MSLDHEFSENLIALNKCKRNYSIIWWSYAIMAAADILFGIIGNIAAWGSDTPLLLADTVIFVPLICFFGCGGASHKNSTLAIAAAALVVSNAILLRICSFCVTGTIFGGMGGIPIKYNVIERGARWYLAMTVITVPVMIMNIKTNRIYHFLEQQIGFPYFNLRYEEQKFNRVQHGIKDEFRQYAEKLKKTESSEMLEITLPQDGADVQTDSKNGVMDEV